MEYALNCDADIILGYDWLRAHDLAFLYDSDEVCLCAERGCTSGRRVRLDLTLDVAASPATRLSPAEARALLSTVGLGAVPTLGRPALWCPRAAPHHCGRARSSGLGRMGRGHAGRPCCHHQTSSPNALAKVITKRAG